MRKSIYTLFLTIIILTVSLGSAFAALPEIDGWTNGALRTTTLDTVSGNKGIWEECDYRTQRGEKYHAVWIEGAGEKGWQPAKENHDISGDRLESGATYRNVEILGQNAILEDQLLLGKSLTIKITGKGTLTLETQNASETELLDAGRRIASILMQ